MAPKNYHTNGNDYFYKKSYCHLKRISNISSTKKKKWVIIVKKKCKTSHQNPSKMLKTIKHLKFQQNENSVFDYNAHILFHLVQVHNHRNPPK